MHATIRYWYFITCDGYYDMWDHGSTDFDEAVKLADEMAMEIWHNALRDDDFDLIDAGAWVEIHSVPMYPDGEADGDCCSDERNYSVRYDPVDRALEWDMTGPVWDDGDEDEDDEWYYDWYQSHKQWLSCHPEMDVYNDFFGEE